MGSVSGLCLNCEALAQSGPPRSNCAGMCACNAHCKLARGAIANDDFEVSFGLVMSAGVRCGSSSELQLFRLRAVIKELQLLSLSSLYHLILSIRSSPMCLACLVFLVSTLTHGRQVHVPFWRPSMHRFLEVTASIQNCLRFGAGSMLDKLGGNVVL